MKISDHLRCLYSAHIEERGDSYVIEVPEQEIALGNVREGGTYRVALLSSASSDTEDRREETADHDAPTPPVEDGESRTVEIENIGDQGDGIARVERGFVVIVPDTDEGERVRVEITDVRENVAFAEVEERLSYYE